MLKAFVLLISLIIIANYVHALADHPYQALSPACEQYGKSKLSRWDYDSAQELAVLMNYCRGNGNASCIKAITAPLSRWEYDSLAEFGYLAQACRGSNTACINWIKSKLSRFDFDDPQEVALVARACFATDMRCVNELCLADRRACDEDRELIIIAATCSSPQ